MFEFVLFGQMHSDIFYLVKTNFLFRIIKQKQPFSENCCIVKKGMYTDHNIGE